MTRLRDHFDELFNSLASDTRVIAETRVPDTISKDFIQKVQALWQITDKLKDTLASICSDKLYASDLAGDLQVFLRDIYISSPDRIGSLPYIRKRLRILLMDTVEQPLTTLERAAVLSELESGLLQFRDKVAEILKKFKQY